MGANYTDTFILASSDSKAKSAQRPTKPGTIAALQYDLLSAHPYELTSEDVLFQVHAMRLELTPEEWPGERTAFFSTPKACLRCSPLVKQFGWGLHHDAQSRIALVAVESEDYDRFSRDPALSVVHGMRSSRK